MARMGQDPRKARRFARRRVRFECGGDFHQRIAVGLHSAAMVAAIHFRQQFERCAMGGDRARNIRTVGDDLQFHAARDQGCDGIGDVEEAMIGKVVRLFQGGDGDAVTQFVRRHRADRRGFGRFQMRAQGDTKAFRLFQHAIYIRSQARLVEQKAGRGQVGNVHFCQISSLEGSLFAPANYECDHSVCSPGIFISGALRISASHSPHPARRSIKR